MIYEVIITEQADADLRGIYEYIAFELLSPESLKLCKYACLMSWFKKKEKKIQFS